MRVSELRSQFPQLGESVYGKPLVYLDNAATSLRPVSVVEKWDEMSLRLNSNLHRAVHHTANVATRAFEDARSAVAGFLGADPGEIVFTSGTTHSINLVAGSLGRMEGFFRAGDEILIAGSEHHSDIIPWQLLAKDKGLSIKVLPVDEKGVLCIDLLPSLLSPRTRICCVAEVSNVLGIINPIKEIVAACHANGTLVLVDGAQAVAHLKVNVKDLDCDFYAFSAHKMYGSPGVGVLYGRKSLLDAMPPYMGGGEMIDSVSWEGSTFAKAPFRFEAGTQNISGVPTLVPAIAMLELMGDPELQAAYARTKNTVLDALTARPDVHIYGLPDDSSAKLPLFSFAVEGVHHEDLALILDKMGIALRSGQMCAEPLMTRFGVTGMLRASFSPYNTEEEALYFIESLDKAIKMLR